MAATPPPGDDGSQERLLPTAESPRESLLAGDEPQLKLNTLRFRKRSLARRRWKWIAGAVALVVFFALIAGWRRGFRSEGPVLQAPDSPLLATLPGYGTFRGIRVVTSLNKKLTFEEPIDAWLSVEYSTQPVNESRFAPPDWPKPFEGTRNATAYGPACIQHPRVTASEECLTFNLYRTPGIPYEKKLPVFIFLHGGAFVSGHGRNFDGPTFVARSKEPLVAVTVQYRVAALGSLPSKLFEEEGLLNLGVRDQRMLLEFMQRYVEYFGGDPDRVTLGGQSAGAHSVGIHLFHNYGEDAGKKLFSQAIIASGAPTARSFPPPDYPLYARQFQQLMEYLVCPTSPNSEALNCLREAPLKDLQYISSHIFGDSKYNLTWPWQPVSPGPLLEKRGSASGIDGTFYKIPLLISSTTDEGKFFAPKNLTTNEDFLNFMSNLLPGLTKDDLDDLDVLYPDPSNGTGDYYDPDLHSPQFERISAAYGDYSYICPVQETAHRLAAAGAPVYKARFNTPNGASARMGVPHASDAGYFNGVTNVQYPDIADIYSSYFASFVVSGNPNTFKAEGAPTWDQYYGVGSGQLAVGNEERGGVVMEEERAGIRMVECRWWRDPERMVRLNK